MPNTSFVDKPIITGGVFIGDSLSDEEKKYSETICGCFPFKWFLHHSDYNNFTNGHTWAYLFGNIFNSILNEKATWLAQKKSNYFKNIAEGGATTYDYRNIRSFFKHIKGFILSFFLGNTQKQVKKIKSILNFTKLGIIFAGANDLVTLGYYDEKGVERAILGIINTVEILTDKSESSNFLRHLLLVGLPDISETPRFANKSDKQKEAIKKACLLYNQKLQEFAKEYQYVNFDCCTIYQYKNINHLDLNKVKNIKKAIVITGEGRERKILFINNGKFITNKSNWEFKKVNISLTKKLQAIFSQDGEIIRDEANGNKLDKFVNKLTKQAKLNIDIKMIGIEPILDEILKNPEAHGFTEGCAAYYLLKKEGQESDITFISKNISGNAVVVQETDNGFFSYLIKDGMLVKERGEVFQVKFELSEVNQMQLRKKLEQPIENGMIKLAGMEDIHDICIIDIIKSILGRYNSFSPEKIVLANISESVLNAVKNGDLNRDYIFWDDLHPARRLHELLALKIAEFIEKQYSLRNPSSFRDDSIIGVKPKLPQSKYAEAPASLSSAPSLLS